jgi:putative colanic acid biosynthesis glycosyltransferase
MKVLQVNCVYNNGSTGKIVHDIHIELGKQGVESVVCYGRGHIAKELNVYKTSSEISAKFNALKARITGLQYNGSWNATHKLIRIIKKEQPTIVHLHCINGYFVNIYRLFAFLKRNKIKTVLTLHAEFMHTGSCGIAYECDKWMTGCGKCPQLWDATKSYTLDRTHTAWEMMKKSFQGFDRLRIISVSQWLEDRAKQSPLMKGHQFKVIGNGIDTEETFQPCDFQYLKERHGLQDEKILLYVTASFSLREDDIKGGRYIVKLANQLKGQNIKIIVVGGRDLAIPLPDNMINVGRTNNQNELAAYYSLADVTILASKRETFSMICAESLSCGTPVVGFKAGAPEQVSLPEYSEFVEYGDLDALERTVRVWAERKSELTSAMVGKAHSYYSKKRMCEGYISEYRELVNTSEERHVRT